MSCGQIRTQQLSLLEVWSKRTNLAAGSLQRRAKSVVREKELKSSLSNREERSHA